MSEPIEQVIDAAADVAAEISQQAEGAEKVIRSLNKIKLAYAGMGIAIGATVGSLISFHIAYRRAETKFSQIAADDIAAMQKHYNEKVLAFESTSSKGDLDEIVRERGYSSEQTEPPMAVTPPSAVVDAAREAEEEHEDDAVPEEDILVEDTPLHEVRNVFREAEVDDTWDWHEERRKRSPLKPYIVHVDERDAQTAYDSVTYTYYEADDVLSNERDEVIAEGERDKLIGEAHLEKFGHGSGDASIVYIRNDHLEMDFEIVRSPNSYAEEVHGFDPPEIRHSIRRRGFDDE